MFHAIPLKDLEKMRRIHDTMFADRAEQFVWRHKWPLKVSAAGFEIDDFDDAFTTYCVTAEEGRHEASLRLRPADAGSMVERHFPALWTRAADRLCGGTEVTRFCAAPTLTPDQRLAAVSDLLLGLCRHCQRTGTTTFFGVVFPSVLRVIRQSGWAPVVIDRMADPSGTLLLCEWTASERVAWNIQECREAREANWTDRRTAFNKTEERAAA